MARKATTTTPDPELSTPLGNEPDQTKPSKKDPRRPEGEESAQEPLEIEHLEGRQESGRDD